MKTQDDECNYLEGICHGLVKTAFAFTWGERETVTRLASLFSVAGILKKFP
jgi:hypothetical protein